ncbi:TonB-dependent receptor [Flavobacteriaceae bacterium TP-CH-4]|uniref:TonB-dependent receptor n=1 Tax=Pelagihabitans pacificus TaxID=2696054 RepID=A0A967AWP3_9FLAO|nr:TonB-dependent receptor plug domain-containing protein [Pelagihabitans pacificus]NHF60523.1 TonB-dependent receptor [Pelagihabitans pacificus]
MRNRLLVLLCVTILGCLYTAAQEAEPSKNLDSVLIQLQERFDVQFNYASVLVDGISIYPPDASLNLKESLNYISEKSKLDFVFVSDRIISIKLKKILLCGYLKDKDSGEALPYVTVQNGSNGVISNEEGFFELEIKTIEDIVQIRHIGHKPIRREARFFNAGECGTIYLVPNQEKLAEVTLYDYLIRGIDKLDNAAFQIDFNKFSILPGLIEEDVLQSVQAFPGIQSVDETVSNINIRGGSNDQNLISWDGIKMYQSGHFFGLISMYNPNITQKVELRKNGTSASDTDGVSGTIAMQTETYLNPKLKGNIGVNLLDANGFVDTPLGKNMSLQIAARKSISGFVETPTYSEYFNRIAQDTEIERNNGTVTNSDLSFDFYDASFRWLYHATDKDRFRTNFIYTTNSLNFNENADVSGTTEIRESNLTQSSIAGAFNYQREWTENFSTEANFYETYYKLNAVNANILEDQRFLQTNEVSETGIKLTAKNRIAQQIHLNSGYNFIETKVTNLDDVDDPRFVRLEGEVLRAHAVFGEMGFSSENSKTQLNLGVRYTYLEKFKKQLLEPRFVLNHSFGQGFNVEVLGEFKHQNTSQIINFQNDFLGVEKRRWQLSNDESIPVITSKQASLGLSYNKTGWLMDLVSFYKKIDGITTQSQGFQDSYEFVRTAGAYDATGIDVLLRKQLNKSNAWLSYAYLKSNYFFNELPETGFPSNFDITHIITLGANYTLNDFLFAAGLNWRTGKPFTQPIADNEVTDGNINFGNANEARQDDYLRVDISAKYEFKFGRKTKAQIGMAVWNVLNRDNTINTFFRTNSLNQLQIIEQSSLGITPNATFRLFFL